MNAQLHVARRAQAVEASLLIEMDKAAEAAKAGGQELVFLLRGEPDFETPPHIVEAAFRAIRDGHTHYTATEGIRPLREAVAAKLEAEQGARYNPLSEVTITTGATMGLHLAIQALIDEGDELIVPGPYYGPYRRVVQYAGGKLVSVPMALQNGRWSLDPAAVEASITDRTRVLLLNSPTNPTGSVFTRAELEVLADIALRHNLAIISDECYDTIVFDGRKHVSIASISEEVRARTFVVNSFSKSYAMTGWRLGYVAAPATLSRPMRQMFNGTGRCATSFAQHAGLAGLTGPQSVVEQMRASYEARRKIACDIVAESGLPFAVPEGAFYVFLDARSLGMPSIDLAKHLLREGGVVTTPGRFFGEDGEGYIRISFATSEGDLRRGLAGINQAVAALRS